MHLREFPNDTGLPSTGTDMSGSSDMADIEMSTFCINTIFVLFILTCIGALWFMHVTREMEAEE